jgi:hypothetical protein
MHSLVVKMYEGTRDRHCTTFVQAVPMLYSKRLEGVPRRYALAWAQKDHSGVRTGDYPLKDFRYQIFTKVYDAPVHYDRERDDAVAEKLRVDFMEKCVEQYPELFDMTPAPSLEEFAEAAKE